MTAPLLERAAERITSARIAELAMSTPGSERDVALRRELVRDIARVILSEPASEEMAAAARAALRQGGLIPAYTDEGKGGQTPILQALLKENALPAAASALLASLDPTRSEGG